MIINVSEEQIADSQNELQRILDDSNSSYDYLNAKMADCESYLKEKDSTIQSRIETYESKLERLQAYHDFFSAECQKMDSEVNDLVHEIHCAQIELGNLRPGYKKEGTNEYVYPDANRSIAIRQQIDTMQARLKKIEVRYDEMHHNLRVSDESLEAVKDYMQILYQARDEYNSAVSCYVTMRRSVENAYQNWLPFLSQMIQKVERLKEYLVCFNEGNFSVDNGVEPSIRIPHFSEITIPQQTRTSFVSSFETKPVSHEEIQIEISKKMKCVSNDVIEIVGKYENKDEFEKDIQQLGKMSQISNHYRIKIYRMISNYLPFFHNTIELDEFFEKMGLVTEMTTMGLRYIDVNNFIYYKGEK